MMTPAECKKAWDTVISCYEETADNNPHTTMLKIIDKLGIESAKEVFATVAKIKAHDGRIYGENRRYMESIPVNDECVIRKHPNPMVYEGLDSIHTTHINQLISELRKMEN